MRRLITLLIVLLLCTNCLALQKNVASQKWVVFAFDDTDNSAKTGDAANITANVRIDGAAANAVDDTNPTELEDGYYIFDITAAESNGENIVICPDSTTANIQVIGCPMAVWTTPANFPDFSVSATNGRVDVIKVAGTTQTANDNGADINAILIDTSTTLDDLIDTEIGTIVTAVGNIETDTAAYDTDAEYATAIWNAATASYGGAGTYGQAVEDILVDTSTTLDDFIDTEVAAILADTGTDGVLLAATATSAQLVDDTWDEVLTGGTHNVATSAGRRLRGIQEFQGYEGGAIWIDTVNGTAGTTDYENGTVELPVDSIANANTIAASLNIQRFEIVSGSTITFAASQQNQVFHGKNWTLALGGQDIAGTCIYGATVSGIASGTGTTQIYEKCILNATSHIKGTHLLECGIANTQTMVEAGDIFFDRCHSGVAGTATWSFDFGAAIANTNLNVRNYSGGIQLESMGDAGTDTASIEGQGQVIEGTCTGGTVAVRGNFTVSGISNLTLSDDARIDVPNIWATLMSDLAAGAPSATASIKTAINYLYEAWRNGYKTDGTNSEIVLYKDDGTTPLVEADIADDGTDFTRQEYGAPD